MIPEKARSRFLETSQRPFHAPSGASNFSSFFPRLRNASLYAFLKSCFQCFSSTFNVSEHDSICASITILRVLCRLNWCSVDRLRE